MSATSIRMRLRRMRSGDFLSLDPDGGRGESPTRFGRFSSLRLPFRKSMIRADDIFSHIAPEDFGDYDRSVLLLIVLHDLTQDPWHRKRRIIERVRVA